MNQFDLVKEGLAERAIFLNNAPHLAKSLKLNTPVYSWKEAFYISAGLFLYKLISFSKSIGSNAFLNKDKISKLESNIKQKNLKGAVSFYDGRFLDSRMVIALLQTAQSFHTTLKNYSEVTNFIYDEDNKLSGVKFYDKITRTKHQIKAKCIINASGANIDNIRLLDDKKAEEILSLSSGIHIVIDKKFLPSQEGILIPKTSDGRVVFILPYLGQCMIGTTDNEVKYSVNLKALDEVVEYLISHVNEYMEKNIEKSDVLSSWSGIRPLVKNNNKSSTQNVVREHLISKSKNGLISIAGGKWTTYRKMSEQVVDFAIKNDFLNKKQNCKTKSLKVIGSHMNLDAIAEVLDSYEFSNETKESLITFYGDKAIEVANLAKKINKYELINKDLPFIKAEVIYTIEYEFVKKPIDFLARRISLCFIDKAKALSCVKEVCLLMANEFNWSEEEITKHIDETNKEINEFY